MSALSIKIGRSCQINFHEAAKPIAKTFHVNYLLDMLKKIFQYPVLAACRFWRPVFLVLPVFCLMAGDAFCAEKSRPLRKNAPEPIVVQSRGLKKAAPKGVYNMREAVMQALSHNPSLAAEEAQSRSSEETRKSRRGAFGPKLGMSYTATKQERKTEPSSSRPPELGTYSWSIEISQPVFQGFQLLASYQRAALQADSDQASLLNSELTMTTNVQSELRITRAFYEVGLRPKLDVLQAEVDVSTAESTLIQAENVRDTAQARLNTLLGFSAAAKIDYVGRLAHVPFNRTLEQCLETAYRQRPDLYMAAKSVEIAEKDQKVAQSDYYPQVEAYYNINQQGNTPDLQRKGNYSSRSSTWEVGARATWNVFQWGTTYYADKSAGWLVTRMRHEEEKLKLDVGYDIKSRLLSLREAEKRITVAEKGVREAREAYEAALARYQEQVGTNFDVLDASSNLTRAQSSLTGSRADYLTALSQLYTAMGEFRPDLLLR